MKYLLFWAIAGLWCKDPLIGLMLMFMAVLFFEEGKPKEEPAKKE